MDIEKLFEKYRRRLSAIGWRKAFLWGLTIGFALVFVAASVIWFYGFSVPVAIVILLGTLPVATFGSAPLIYTLFYRPTRDKVARRIDRLGLEERYITMCDREGDDSFIAALQRKDAEEKLSSVDAKQFVFHLSKAASILLIVAVTLGLVMATVSMLSSGGIIESGNEIFAPNDPDDGEEPGEEDDSLCVIVYAAGEGGIVEGETVQRLEKGQDTTPVTAVPDPGYDFVGWSDGDPRATRIDYSVQESKTLTAKFAKQVEPDIPVIEGGPGGDSGMAGEVPGGDVGLGGGAGGSGNSGMMEGDDVNGDSGGGAGAMEDKEDNSVIDGVTDYKYEFDYDAEIEALLNDETLSDEVKDYLSDYLDALRQIQESERES